MTQKAISELRPNPFSEKIYGNITEYPQFFFLKHSIDKEGILEPLVITETNLIVSGVRRYKAALELGMKKVPVVIKDINENEVSESKVINHQQHRVKSPVQIYIEIERLSEEFNLVQGRKKFKFDEKEASVKKKELLGFLKRSYGRLKEAHKNLFDVYGSKEKVYEKMIELEKKENLKPESILKTAKKINTEAKKDTKRKPIDFPEKYEILNQNSMDKWKGIKNNSVDCIINSVPYFNLKDYETEENQIGIESEIKPYLSNLLKVFENAKKALKDTGSLFVNINDVVINGCLQNIPWTLANEMMKSGWIFNSNIIWAKDNPRYQANKRPVQSYEYILHFVKTTDFKYFPKNEKEIREFEKKICYGDVSKQMILKDFWDFRNLTIECPVAHNLKLTNKLNELGIEQKHTATFPVEIPTACILSTTEPGDVVADCFSGLGTSGIAAIGHNRYYYGIENNSDYIEASKYRIEMFIEEMEEREKEEKKKEDEELKKEHSVQRLVEKKIKGKVLPLEYGENISNESTIKSAA